MKQWLVRNLILNPVREADSGIARGFLRFFPDHPGGRLMNAEALDDDFWNDPYPEGELSIQKIEGFFKPPIALGPVSIILTLSSAVRDGVRSQNETG